MEREAAASVALNDNDKVCLSPAFKIVPAAGEYVNAPSMSAVAFNCVPLNAVP